MNLRCRSNRVLSHIALAIGLSGSSLTAQELHFLQMADPQFGMFSNNQDILHETANLEFAIANANRLRPAFVIICGDLTNRPADAAQIAEYHRITKKLDPSIKLFNVAGNHDVGNIPTLGSLDTYRQNYGPDYYVFRFPDFEGVVLNSSLIQHPEQALDEARKQELWLEEELQRAQVDRVKQIVVFQHIPLFLKDADEPDQYFNIPAQTRKKYLDLLSRYGVSDVFAGHYHRNAYGEYRQLHMFTTGPVGKPLGPDPSGFRAVVVTASGIKAEYWGLGNIPDKFESRGVASK